MTAEQDCGLYVADWEQLADFWKNNAQALSVEIERLREANWKLRKALELIAVSADAALGLRQAALEKQP